jgi:hypothetical protein
MPGFGDNPNTPEDEGDGMMSEEMIRAIANYEANLPAQATTTDAPAPAEATTTTTTAAGTTTTTEP